MNTNHERQMMKHSLTRRGFIKALGFGAAALAARGLRPAATGVAAPAAGAAGGKLPNFIVLFTDDQGYQDIKCFGSPLIRTPNLDKMAAEGMRFTDFYSVGCVCSPARAGLLTGCYPPRVGVTAVLFPPNLTGLSPYEITIAEMLKPRGYATCCIGKWHLGHGPQALPTAQGFDTYFGIPYSNDMTYNNNIPLADNCVFREGFSAESVKTGKPARHKVPLMRDDKVVEYPADQSTLTQRYTAEAVRFITANKDKPFFIYLPHTMPHVPLAASEKFKGKSPRGLYGDAIEEIDWSTGEIIKTLQQLGLDDNTLVIFTSDNGPWLSMKENGGCALPLRDGKFTTWDGGMREPTIMRWPGHIPAGKVCSEVAATIDFMPTLAALAGTKPPADRVIDGKDILPLMTGQDGAKSPHEGFFYYRGNNLECVRSGKWKLRVKTSGGGRAKNKDKNKGKDNEKAPAAPKVAKELYDLQADISEKTNVADQHPDIVEKLSKMMEDFDKALKADREKRK